MIKTILLDIEGTTTPIDFVHKTLFPFARHRIGSYVDANFSEMPETIADLQAEHSRDAHYTRAFDPGSPESVSDYLIFLIDEDRKSTQLKAIQGEIWRQGYDVGALKSEIFDDVPGAFARWNAAGKTIAIYSSGSILAQQLLFRCTGFGDLTPFISHYFDTNVGGKRDKDSYSKIAGSLDLRPSSILFISDVPSELAAAKDAGLDAMLSMRPGNSPLADGEGWRVVTSFDQID